MPRHLLILLCRAALWLVLFLITLHLVMPVLNRWTVEYIAWATIRANEFSGKPQSFWALVLLLVYLVVAVWLMATKLVVLFILPVVIAIKAKFPHAALYR